MKEKKFFLFLFETFLMFLSLYLVVLFRYPQHAVLSFFGPVYGFPFLVIYLFWAFILYIWGFYDFHIKWKLFSYIYPMAINIVFAFLFFVFFDQHPISPKTNLILTALLFIIFDYPFRLFYRYLFIGKFNKQHVMLIVNGSDYEKVFYDLERYLLRSSIDLRCLLWLSPEGQYIHPFKMIPGLRNEKDLNRLDELIEELKINTVILTHSVASLNDPHLAADFYRLLFKGIDIYDYVSFLEEHEALVKVEVVDKIWFVLNLKAQESRLETFMKRLVDVSLALVILPLLLVFSFIAVIGILLTDRGPILYSQLRVGRQGKVFRIYKFRSMYINAEKEGQAQWSVENDPRITPWGRIMRSLRLDELPQILNVLRGEMSFVGPRPERPEFVEMLATVIPHYELRHLVRPGLTGWAQINYPYGASQEDALRKLEYDLYYLIHRGFIFDTKILAKTMVTVMMQRGR